MHNREVNLCILASRRRTSESHRESYMRAVSVSVTYVVDCYYIPHKTHNKVCMLCSFFLFGATCLRVLAARLLHYMDGVCCVRRIKALKLSHTSTHIQTPQRCPTWTCTEEVNTYLLSAKQGGSDGEKKSLKSLPGWEEVCAMGACHSNPDPKFG